MEQDKLPGADPGQCGSDREVFERVWRRVMPEDRPDCPFRLYGEEERAGMERLLEQGAAGEPPAAGPAPAQSAPAVPAVLPPAGKRRTGGSAVGNRCRIPGRRRHIRTGNPGYPADRKGILEPGFRSGL